MRYLRHRANASDLVELVRETQPELINLAVANNRAMTLQCLHAAHVTGKPMVTYRGAIGGLNVLSPIDHAIMRHRNLRRVIALTFAMSSAWANNPGMRLLVPPEKVEVSGRAIGIATVGKNERTKIRAELGIAPDDFALGSIANSRPIKNLEFAARVVAGLGDSGKPAKLVLIGRIDETTVQRLKNLSGDRLIATGFKANAAPLAAGFDVCVSPTRRPGEGFGKSIAEAMIQGVPAVSSNFGGACDIIESGTSGFLLPLNEQAWVHAIGQLFEDRKQLQAMGAAAQARIQNHFSKEALERRNRNIFASVIEEWRKMNSAAF